VKNLPNYPAPVDFSVRVKTAAIALFITLPIIIWGKRLPLFLLIGIVNIIGLKEFCNLTLPKKSSPLLLYPLLLSIIFLAWGYQSGNYLHDRSGPMYTVFSLTLITFLTFIFYLLNFLKFRYLSSPALIFLFGLFYITIPSFLVILIYSSKGGKWILLFILTVVWIGDSGAYAIGRWLGRHPLYPAVSPKKTVEGSIGGLIFSLLATLTLQRYLLPGLNLRDSLFLGLGIGILAQLGDLSESFIKRKAGVKDSGNVFPGHGGMLDRIDSLLFSVPFVYFYLWSFVQEFMS